MYSIIYMRYVWVERVWCTQSCYKEISQNALWNLLHAYINTVWQDRNKILSNLYYLLSKNINETVMQYKCLHFISYKHVVLDSKQCWQITFLVGLRILGNVTSHKWDNKCYWTLSDRTRFLLLSTGWSTCSQWRSLRLSHARSCEWNSRQPTWPQIWFLGTEWLAWTGIASWATSRVPWRVRRSLGATSWSASALREESVDRIWIYNNEKYVTKINREE